MLIDLYAVYLKQQIEQTIILKRQDWASLIPENPPSHAEHSIFMHQGSLGLSLSKHAARLHWPRLLTCSPAQGLIARFPAFNKQAKINKIQKWPVSSVGRAAD